MPPSGGVIGVGIGVGLQVYPAAKEVFKLIINFREWVLK
jgi:hypothetical protein